MYYKLQITTKLNLKNMKNLDIRKVKEMSYTDFIGLINQTNVPPGSYVTLSKWIHYSRINNESSLLEIACTTGFSSREISLITDCKSHGVDISQKSVNTAIENKNSTKNSDLITYEAIDANMISDQKSYSHVVVGAGLGFFPKPEETIEKITSILCDGGYLLASPFYVKKEIPRDLIEKAKSVFGITPTQISYKEVMQKYAGFEVFYEDRCEILQETEEELAHYCKSTIDRFMDVNGIVDEGIYKETYDRLYQIKKMSNELRPFQEYSILVLRYRKGVYPNRYTELF
jgi:ubiquinone/menaquinone biosynthesis C-methylase UbiE